PGQSQCTVGLPVEAGTAGDQLTDAPRRFFNEDPHGLGFAHLGTCEQCVEMVSFWRVAWSESSCDAALGKKGVALEQRTFGYEERAAELGRSERSAQAGYAASDHEKVAVQRSFHPVDRLTCPGF